MTIIKEEGMEEINENHICEIINEKYSLSFQPTIIRQVLSHAMSKNLITKIREKYTVISSSIDQYTIPQDDFDKSWHGLLDGFIYFCKKRNQLFEKAEIEKDILKFIDSYDDRVVYNNIDDINSGNNKFLYHWCNYIIALKESNPSKYEFVLALCSANLLKNTLFYTSQNTCKKSNLKVFLDTPMIFALLGMDTPERKQAFEYIIDKAKEAGMSLHVFEHNYDEVLGILDRGSRWALSNQYDSAKANKVAEFFHDSGMDEDEILDFISMTAETIESYGITIEDSSYLTEENNFQADESTLHELIKTEYGKRAMKFDSDEVYDSSIHVDVRSIVMIQRKRCGNFSTDLKNSRYLFITTNSAIAKVSKDYAASEKQTRDKIPSCVTADIFGTLLWMEFPSSSNSFLSLKLLADCKSLLRPSPQMIAIFNLRLDEAYKQRENGLTEERFLFLRSHPIVRNKLLDVTSGDYNQFTSTTWRDVYNAIESHAAFEGEKKYENEKVEHQKTITMLDQAKNDLINKNNELKNKETKIEAQSELFSTILSRIISILIFGLPYLAITVTIAIIQNTYLDTTIKGYIIGATTVIISILLAFFYKKLESKIKKYIKKKVE